MSMARNSAPESFKNVFYRTKYCLKIRNQQRRNSRIHVKYHFSHYNNQIKLQKILYLF